MAWRSAAGTAQRRRPKAVAAQRAVRVFKAVKYDDNVRHAGEDQRQGDTILARGTVIRPAEVGVLGSLGRTSVAVVQRPRVAILSTGDEVVEIDRPLAPGLIRNANSYSLAALVRWYGGEPLMLGIAADTVESLRELLWRGAAGGHDRHHRRRPRWVTTTWSRTSWRMTATSSFWSIDMRPGKPVAFRDAARRAVHRAAGQPGLDNGRF